MTDENESRDPLGAGAAGGNGMQVGSAPYCTTDTNSVSRAHLNDAHLATLRDGSGITEAVILARGYRTITEANELRALGFAPVQCRAPGLLLPVHTPDGGESLYVYRPDNPRCIEDKSKGRLPDGTYPQKVIKYELPKGTGVRLDCPPTCRPMLADPSIPLWVTEGQKKADALASRELCAIALLGVWNFKGKNPLGGTTLLADWDYIALDGRDVRVVFDSDVMTKSQVRQALARLTEHLQRKQAHVSAVYLSDGRVGKVGVDDYLVAGHSVDDLNALVDAPRPEPKPAAPMVELLDAPPPALHRPLALVAECAHAYAATWLYVRVTTPESVGRAGEIVKHDPPKIKREKRLFVVRDDGQMFGEGGGDDSYEPLDMLGLEVRLPETPPADKLWTARGVKAYRTGQRPDPVGVFGRVVNVVDRFIDFDRSLADQRTMAEVIGCYILGTWFLDAFNVIGFLWPNGDRGSGKTQLLTVIAELGYLGQVILSGGSYASLRDLADYGACLAFDDAEGLADSKRTDPDKHALLLAGNRRGNTVPVKEQDSDRKWRTRYVNTFCARLFSATRLPDPILASRTIVIPLIRTPDRYRANADPLDHKLWPHDRQGLLDDLWALALARLMELQPFEEMVNQQARLTGRNLEPWRALLAVALWLDGNGVPGLWERMEGLSVSYQNERPELETGDLTALVIRGLCRYAVNAVNAVCSEIPHEFQVKTADITEATISVAQELEADIEANWINARRVGRVLGKMRLRKDRSGKSKAWRVALSDLARWTKSYGIPLPSELSNQENGTLPINGTNDENDETAQGDTIRMVWPADSLVGCPVDRWQRRENGEIEAEYTRDELELAVALAG